jgi:hypothetical protein
MASLLSVLWQPSAERDGLIRTMRTAGWGWLRLPRLGFAALGCVVSALIWSLTLAAAAHADTDTTPVLTDGSSTTAAVVGDTVKLAPGTYTEDPGSVAVQDSWYDCGSNSPPQTAIGASPAGCTLITPTPSTSYVVRAGDVRRYIVVLETDLTADAVTGQTNQVASNTLAVSARTPPPPAAPTNLRAPSIAGPSTFPVQP